MLWSPTRIPSPAPELDKFYLKTTESIVECVNILKMQRITGFVVIVLFLGFATFALAKSENSNNGNGNGQSNGNGQNQGQGSQNPNKNKESNNEEASSPTPSASATSNPAQICDPNANWKNHGEYVSCVAKLKLGGQAVSEAAKSNIGKKNSTPSASLVPSPTATSSASPSASVSASPTAEATSSAIAQVFEPVRNGARNLINSLRHLIEQFQALFRL